MSGYSPLLELGDDPHHLTPREKVPYTLNEISGEIRRRYPAAFDGTDPLGAHPPSLENATDLFLATCLSALASGSGDHAELARLAEAAKAAGDPFYSFGDVAEWGEFQKVANPDAVLALLAEIAALRAAKSQNEDDWAENLAELRAESQRHLLRATEAERKLAEAVAVIRDADQAARQAAAMNDAGYTVTVERTATHIYGITGTFLSKEAEQ